MTDEKVLDRNIADFIEKLIPFGSGDVSAAVETALDAGKDGDWAAEQVTEYMDQTSTKLEDIDVNYCVYDSLLQEVRSEIETATRTDILNDMNPCIEVYANCLDTQFNYEERTRVGILTLIAQIEKDDRSDVLNWFVGELNSDEKELIELAKEAA